MRDDMHRVIIERPRILDRYAAPRPGRRQSFDDLPSKQGMRRRCAETRSEKGLNDHLAPLRRYLARQVGRPWDKVFSEVAAKFGTRGTIHYHLRRHLLVFVALKPRRGDYAWRGPDGRRLMHSSLWREPFYVDERDGILKRTDQLPEEKARRRKAREAKRQAGKGKRSRPAGALPPRAGRP
jgi:hypothetical protein